MRNRTGLLFSIMALLMLLLGSSPFASFAVQTSSATVVTCSPGTISSLQGTTCTASVTGNSPTGSVTWQSSIVGGFSSGSCTLSSGSCSVTFSPSSSGVAVVTASYGGDTNNLGSYGSFSVQVNTASGFGTRSFFDGFETYKTGSVASGSSILLGGNNQGWAYSETCASITAAVTNGPGSGVQPYDGAQEFGMTDGSTSCGSATSGNLALSVIATSSAVTATVFTYETTSKLDGGVFYSNGNSYDVSSVGQWAEISSTGAATVGSSYTVSLSCTVISATSANSCYFDDVVIYGAALKNSPTDFAIYDYAAFGGTANGLYNIVGYSGASSNGIGNAQTIVNYTHSIVQSIQANVSSPDLNLPFSKANTSLITVWVNSQYYRSVIPTANSIYMVLDAPNLVNSYNFQFQNPSGILSSGDPVYFTIGDVPITSGYLDSSFSFPAWLRAGTYNIQITNMTGHSLFTSSVTVAPSGSFQTPYQIVVVNQTSTYQSTGQSSISVGEALSGTTLTVSFQDSTNTTSLVNTTLYQRTGSGGSVVLGGVCIATYVKTGCAEQTKIGIATSAYTIQVNQTGAMYFIFAFNQSNKITTIGPYPVQSGSILGNTQGGANNCVYGCIGIMLGAGFNSSTAVILDLISITIVITIAAAFDGKYANFAVLVLAIVTGSLWAAGWINLTALGIPSAAMAIMAVLAVLGMGAEKEKQAETLFETGG